MSRVFLKYGLLLLGLCASAHGQSLKELLNEAGEKNVKIKAAYLEFEMALEKVSQHNSLPDPNLSIGYFISPIETRVGPQQARLSLTQMFPWFGSLKAKGDVFSLKADAKYHQFLDVRNQVYLDIKGHYYTLWEVEEQITLKQENLKLLESLREVSQNAFSNGKAKMTDVIKVGILIDRNKTDLLLLKEKQKSENAFLNALLSRTNRENGFKPNVSENLDFKLISVGADSVLSNQSLLAMDQQINSANENIRWNKKNGLPAFGLGMNYVFIGSDAGFSGEDAIMPMLSVSLPIYRKKYKAAIKAAELEKKVFEEKKSNLQNQLIAQLSDAINGLQSSKLMIDLCVKQINDSQRLLELITTDYTGSGNDFEEVLRVQMKILTYKIEQKSAVRAYYTFAAKLEFLTGKEQ